MNSRNYKILTNLQSFFPVYSAFLIPETNFQLYPVLPPFRPILYFFKTPPAAPPPLYFASQNTEEEFKTPSPTALPLYSPTGNTEGEFKCSSLPFAKNTEGEEFKWVLLGFYKEKKTIQKNGLL